MKTMNLGDTIILFVGFYFLISTAMMKVHGKVNRMMKSKKYDETKAKDLPGFINHMFVPNIVIGVITMIVGFAHYFAVDIYGKQQLGLYIYVAYVVVFFIYAIYLALAQKKYLSPE
ncbi:MAG: hypothetical protein IJG52_08505 [Lachnospiraceae bacterium]|nr:hypothetical protein [Lachnospiraceae bacterium]MBQ3406791.1 hypothetical protein [Lachnospiraceae bacterium]